MQRTDLLSEANRRSARRERIGRRLGVLAWALFFSGLLGILFDSVSSISAAALGFWYLLAFTGAALFTVGAVLKGPTAPPFLEDAPDPWERMKDPDGSRG
ncbi:MAG TPA: hypothetical protein VFJ58_01230 [Armatimonadota bacterium]|nr:hypothetical protein [Armatimonadota bacterium]